LQARALKRVFITPAHELRHNTGVAGAGNIGAQHAKKEEAMKKLMNDPKAYVDESLDGLCSAFPGYARTGATGRVIARKAGVTQGQVGIVSGGGFGHLPLFAGYVGEGMLNACAVGNVFAGPPAEVCAETIRAADGGKGVLCVLGKLRR
jgi:dihydroxyacetone kinase-like protein